ncbi:MAG TPA: Sir2 family NAD-dependent protein deacetylase [Sediminibacterium sp.]|nr:Sir2 family NAD-dependent protein deacetylase [Sediminibacterium sp.]
MSRKKLVVLTGAGISADSGLKTFRDSDGLWEGYPVHEVATPEGWASNPALVLEFYNQRRRQIAAALPNAAHRGLAALEQFFDVTIITQNIDDLHERGGSSKIIHLHGQIFQMRSEWDETIVYPVTGDISLGEKAPDGGQLRPHIVWFGEPVPMIEEAAKITRQADILVVIGSSLVVYPAAGLLQFAAKRIPKFILDKNIPDTGLVHHLTAIEASAAEGIGILKDKLMALG